MRLRLFSTGLMCGLAFYVNAQVSELSDLQFFVGSGSDTAGLVIDFRDGQGAQAWGVLFNDSTDGKTMLEEVASADPTFSVDVASGFLNSIFFDGQQGIGGQPDYWGTWSGTPFFWTSNLGIGTSVLPGTWFGCSYMDFNPAIEPSLPLTAVIGPLKIHETYQLDLHVYPAPFSDVLLISNTRPVRLLIYDASGKQLLENTFATKHELQTSTWTSGVYLIVAETESGQRAIRRAIK